MDLDNLHPDILTLILNNIEINTNVKYIPMGDGEQNYTIFYKNYYPYHLVCHDWKNIIEHIS